MGNLLWARTVAATEEFSQSIQVPSSTHPGTTYPVRAIPHSDLLQAHPKVLVASAVPTDLRRVANHRARVHASTEHPGIIILTRYMECEDHTREERQTAIVKAPRLNSLGFGWTRFSLEHFPALTWSCPASRGRSLGFTGGDFGSYFAELVSP